MVPVMKTMRELAETNRDNRVATNNKKALRMKGLEEVEKLSRSGKLAGATRKLDAIIQMEAQQADVEPPAYLSLTKEQNLGYIKALHPEVLDPAHGVAERGVDPNISNLPALQLTQEDVLAAIRHLPRGSAAGFNGWTYDAVRSICLYLPNQANFAEALVILFNKMLRGDRLMVRGGLFVSVIFGTGSWPGLSTARSLWKWGSC
jgi:hypothetical protein